MGAPLPPEIILPTGEPAYLNPYRGTYTTSRSYAQRMQRGYSRGLTQSAARRGPGAYQRLQEQGISESRDRRERELARTGQTSSTSYQLTFQMRYGFPYNEWRRLWRLYIREINELSSPDVRIDPSIVAQELENSSFTGHDMEWVENRLAGKLQAMLAYRQGSSVVGYQYFMDRDYMAPIEWWWYH